MSADMDVVQRLTTEGYLKGDLAVFDELVADGLVDHDPGAGFPGTKEGWRQAAEMVVSAFSDRQLELDDYLESTDGRIINSWAMRATHTGEAMGFPATGASVRFRGIDIFRCSDGQIAEHWGAFDMSDFMEKIQAAAG
jgi:steroid delta-isomerase-like uncharacterized protein